MSNVIELNEAMKIVRAAGYRVSKPKARKVKKSLVGPTCVVTFHDNKVIRMSTNCTDDKLDYAQGQSVCITGWQAAWRHSNKLAASPWGGEPIPSIVACHFERDGAVIDRLELAA